MTTEYGIFPQIVVNLLILLCISKEYSIFYKVQFMALDYTLCPNGQSAVYIPSLEHSLGPQSTVYALRVQLLQSTVYVLKVQFPQRTVYVRRAQFISLKYSLCLQSTGSVPREQCT